MQREFVIERLRRRGCRITKQREMLLDVILQEECASCKEIYYKANALDSRIGTATVYRMIEFEDLSTCQLSAKNWYKVISEGLKACGYDEGKNVSRVMVAPCENECC